MIKAGDALDRLEARRLIAQIAFDNVDVEPLDITPVAARPRQDAHGLAARQQGARHR